MKKRIVCIGLALLGVACANAPELPNDTSDERATESAREDTPDEEAAIGQSQSALSNCRHQMVACCNSYKNAKIAYQCFGAGRWVTISSRCAPEWPCAW